MMINDHVYECIDNTSTDVVIMSSTEFLILPRASWIASVLSIILFMYNCCLGLWSIINTAAETESRVNMCLSVNSVLGQLLQFLYVLVAPAFIRGGPTVKIDFEYLILYS